MLVVPKNSPVKLRKKMKSDELEACQSLETEFRVMENKFGSPKEIREAQAKIDASLRKTFRTEVGFPHSKLYQRRVVWWSKELAMDQDQINKENNDICKKIQSGDLKYVSVRQKGS